jgi:hypothetical protein
LKAKQIVITKQKLLEVQAKLKEKEKERRQVQGQAAQFKACQAEKKSLSDELAKSNTEVGRLKRGLEINLANSACGIRSKHQFGSTSGKSFGFE